jgi:hypothetical protein
MNRHFHFFGYQVYKKRQLRFQKAGGSPCLQFPVTGNALQPVYGGGSGDAFLAHISTDNGLLYSSYLGGPGADVAAAVALTPISYGTIYVTGSTDSNFPVTNAIQGFNSGQTDAFVAKFSLAPDYSINIPPLNVPIGGSAVETITMQSIDEDAGLFQAPHRTGAAGRIGVARFQSRDRSQAERLRLSNDDHRRGRDRDSGNLQTEFERGRTADSKLPSHRQRHCNNDGCDGGD